MEDCNQWTSAGVAAGMGMAAAPVRRLTREEVAEQVHSSPGPMVHRDRHGPLRKPARPGLTRDRSTIRN